MRILFAMALAVASCAPVTPQLAEAQVPPAIATCVAAAEGREALQRCKGIVFAACRGEPDNADSTVGLVLCGSREAYEWDALLNTALARVAEMHPDRREQLRDAQLAWLGWREAECTFHRADVDGGSGVQVARVACDLDLTADRVIALTLYARNGGRLY